MRTNNKSILSKTFLLLSMTTLSLTFIGCSEFQSAQKFSEIAESLSQVDSGVPVQSAKPYCELDYAEYELDTTLLGFEMKDKNGISFGFGLKQLFKAIGLGFQSKSGTMTVQMTLHESLRPLEEVTNVIGEGKYTENELSINFSTFSNIGAGFDHYSRTSVGRLSEKTLKNAYEKTMKELVNVKKQVGWRTKIVKEITPTEFIIPAGAITGLRVGDQLKIFNLDIVWKGQPCRSHVEFERKTTDQPIAKAVVTQIENKAALIRVYESSTPMTKIELGARVEIENLPLNKKEKARSLKHALRIRHLVSRPLPFEDGRALDISPFFEPQIRALLSDFGFYPRN